MNGRRARHGLVSLASGAALALATLPVWPATITWVGPNAGFWDVAGNWNPGLPGAPDDAALGSFDTVFRSGTVTIQSFTGTGLLSITGGTLTVTNASTIGSLTQSNGSLGGTGNVTITGNATFTFGDQRGTGT